VPLDCPLAQHPSHLDDACEEKNLEEGLPSRSAGQFQTEELREKGIERNAIAKADDSARGEIFANGSLFARRSSAGLSMVAGDGSAARGRFSTFLGFP